MPFTFSHPAIILPFLKKRRKIFSVTGLVIGSIAPDFESFTRLSQEKIYSHTWLGMFWYDLPLALLLCFIFHGIVRDPLIENLPAALQQRFEPYRNVHWFSYFKKNLLPVIISLLIGIAAHLLWDAFTHLNLAYPDSTDSKIVIGHARLYILLQYACSLVGLVAIGWVVYKMPEVPVKRTSRIKFKYWLFIILLATLFGACLTTMLFNEPDFNDIVTSFAVFFINISISSSLSALIVVSLLYKIYSKNKAGTFL